MPTTHTDTREVPLGREKLAHLDVVEGLAAFLDGRYPDDHDHLKHPNLTDVRDAIVTVDGGRLVGSGIEALRADHADVNADTIVFRYSFQQRGGPLSVEFSCCSTKTEPMVQIVVSDTDLAVVQGLLHVLEAEANRIVRSSARRAAELEPAPPAPATRAWSSTLLDHPMGTTVVGTLLAAGILTLVERVFG